MQIKKKNLKIWYKNHHYPKKTVLTETIEHQQDLKTKSFENQALKTKSSLTRSTQERRHHLSNNIIDAKSANRWK